MSEPIVSAVEYRGVPGFPGYRVGDDGSVWTCLVSAGPGGGKGCRKPGGTWRQMRATVDKKGRPKVTLRRSGLAHTAQVCRLVIESFVSPRPPGMQCCHGDGNPRNNRVSNLRWDTHRANCLDAVRHGTTCRGEKNSKSKITATDIPRIFEARQLGKTHRQIAAEFGINFRTVGYILRGKLWGHVPTSNA